jgi:hypothetical protein
VEQCVALRPNVHSYGDDTNPFAWSLVD